MGRYKGHCKAAGRKEIEKCTRFNCKIAICLFAPRTTNLFVAFSGGSCANAEIDGCLVIDTPI